MRNAFTCIAIVAGAALALACASTGTTEEEASAPRDFSEGRVSPGDSTSTRRVSQLETVYFDYDRAEIRQDASSALRANKQAIDAASWDRIVLEGHCDERGSEEYNLALGERRAAAVKRYLTQLGVPASKIQTVSYGESRPAVAGSTETAWAQNRRVEFGVAD